MEKSKKSRFFFRFCFAQEKRQGGGDKEPSPSYYVKPRALIYKGLRQLTISLYLSKQS